MSLVAFCALAAMPASALEVTNRAAQALTIVVVEAGQSREVTMAAGETSATLCAGGCAIRLPNGDEYELEGGEVVSIEEDMLFLDDVGK